MKLKFIFYIYFNFIIHFHIFVFYNDLKINLKNNNFDVLKMKL